MDLTPTEVNLLIRVMEANDSTEGRWRRIGGARTRAELMTKLYAQQDANKGAGLTGEEETVDVQPYD